VYIQSQLPLTGTTESAVPLGMDATLAADVLQLLRKFKAPPRTVPE
jgi:hypothetical protein